MNIIFIILGLGTLLIFHFKMEWLLRKPFSIFLLLWNVILFIMSYILIHLQIGKPKATIFLKVSLLSQLIFFPSVAIFRKLYGRDPKDTFWTMDRSLMADGIFNAIFFLLAFIVPIILIFAGVF